MVHINWESEEDVIFKINLLVKYKSSFIQMIVPDNNNDTVIPRFDFEYIICDCSKDWDMQNWSQYFETDKPVVFINTTDMFNIIEQNVRENIEYINPASLIDNHGGERTGAGIWAQNFYFNYRDRLWLEERSKFIFIVKEKDIQDMWNSVNAGFTIELNPYYYRKELKKTFRIKPINTIAQEDK